MELQVIFINNIQAIHKASGKAWLKQLPAYLEELAHLWNFRFIKQLPDLTYNFVGLVKLNSNSELAIIKIIPDRKLFVSEVRWLKHFVKNTPEIYNIDKKKSAFLMEYLQPGNPLKTLVQAGDDEKATRIICHTILALQAVQKKIVGFKHLSALVSDLIFLKGHMDSRVLSKAQSLFHDLTIDHSQDVLLHGDLHHDNIIRHNNCWKVIDPHGYIGDPAAESAAMLYNPIDCFPNDRSLDVVITTRLNILIEELPFDAQKIKAWAFCLTALSAAWNVQDFSTVAKKDIEIVYTLDKIKHGIL